MLDNYKKEIFEKNEFLDSKFFGECLMKNQKTFLNLRIEYFIVRMRDYK